MAVAGLPIPVANHAEAVINMSLEVLESLKEFNEANKKLITGKEWNIRVGVHTGRVVAGVIGKRKYLYDLYGESVTIAVTMEAEGSPGRVHISESTYEQVKNKFICEEAKIVNYRKKPIKTYFVTGRKQLAVPNPHEVNEAPVEHQKARMPALALSIANPIWKQLNTEIEDLQNVKLARFTLAFPLPEVEKEFQRYYFAKNLITMRLACLILFAFIFVLELFDPALKDKTTDTGAIVIRVARYAFFAPACLFVFFASFLGAFEKLMQVALAVLVSLFYLVWIIGGFFESIHFAGVGFAHVATFFMLKIYFKYSVIIGVVYQIAFIVCAAVTDFVSLVSMLTVTVGVGVYGAVSNYIFERYLRQTLVNQKLLSMEQERLMIETKKSKELLNNLLPKKIAKSLKTNGQATIAERYSNVTVMFAHIVGLNRLQDELEIKELFKLVNQIFCKFDDITDFYKIEKIKTIGSSYMVASGLDQYDSREFLKQEVCKSIEAAIAMMDYLDAFNEEQRQLSQRDLTSTPIHLGIRIGIHIGPVVAGVIGKKKFVSYLHHTFFYFPSSALPGLLQRKLLGLMFLLFFVSLGL